MPNDPRGSWSQFVGAWDLFRFGGRATKVSDTRSFAKRPHDLERRREAKRRLKYPVVRLNGKQARSVATGFRRAAVEGGYEIFACAILHDHVHLIVGRHSRNVSQIVAHLKARATQHLIAEHIHPLGRFAEIPSPWARKYWKVFIDDVSWVRNAIGYVEDNPEKEGKRRQNWKMVVPFLG